MYLKSSGNFFVLHEHYIKSENRHSFNSTFNATHKKARNFSSDDIEIERRGRQEKKIVHVSCTFHTYTDVIFANPMLGRFDVIRLISHFNGFSDCRKLYCNDNAI